MQDGLPHALPPPAAGGCRGGGGRGQLLGAEGRCNWDGKGVVMWWNWGCCGWVEVGRGVLAGRLQMNRGWNSVREGLLIMWFCRARVLSLFNTVFLFLFTIHVAAPLNLSLKRTDCVFHPSQPQNSCFTCDLRFRGFFGCFFELVMCSKNSDIREPAECDACPRQ